MRLATALMAPGLMAGLVASCGASQDAASDFPDPDVAGRAANPDGVPYPTDHLGGNPHAGTRLGDRIPNYTFQAYVDGDRAAGLQTISLADLYDPAQKRFKVLDLQVAATWCAVCSAVTDETVKVKAALASEGVVFLDIVVAGPSPSTGPALADVDAWIARHGSNYTTGIDVRGHRLAGIGVDRTQVPYDIVVDLRTMEILEASAGPPKAYDVAKFGRSALAYVASHPPAAY
jgi:hypothetical protein